MFNAMGLAALMAGRSFCGRGHVGQPLPGALYASLALGSLAGTLLDLDGRFQRMMASFHASQLGEGLSTAILLCCVGTMSILGPIESAIYGNNTYLYTNATLDFVTFIALSSTYGIGIALRRPFYSAGRDRFIWEQRAVRISVRASDGGDFDCGRRADCRLRPVYFKNQGLQNHEYASVPAGSSGLVSDRKSLGLG